MVIKARHVKHSKAETYQSASPHICMVQILQTINPLTAHLLITMPTLVIVSVMTQDIVRAIKRLQDIIWLLYLPPPVTQDASVLASIKAG